MDWVVSVALSVWHFQLSTWRGASGQERPDQRALSAVIAVAVSERVDANITIL